MGRLKRLVVPAALVLGAYWALFGGEYTVFEVREARRATAVEEAALERLRVEIDALEARSDSLENDLAALERLARERFGMIHEGEVLYRFADPAPATEAGPPGG